jgi:hypothetical protein
MRRRDAGDEIAEAGEQAAADEHGVGQPAAGGVAASVQGPSRRGGGPPPDHHDALPAAGASAPIDRSRCRNRAARLRGCGGPPPLANLPPSAASGVTRTPRRRRARRHQVTSPAPARRLASRASMKSRSESRLR